MRSFSWARSVIALLSLGVAACPPPAWAHRDDYIDETFVYQTLGGGEREIEVWGETHADQGQHPRYWYTGAFEYGIISRWTLDGAAQWLDEVGTVGLGRLRSETRYRFAEEGVHVVDLATSLEYELETDRATGEQSEQVLTPRLVTSRDILTSLNTTLNLDLPVTISAGGGTQFRYALGIRYPAEGFLRGGMEFKQVPAHESA